MTKQIVTTLNFNGMSPQKSIRYLKNLINCTKLPDKPFLRIEEYNEDYGDPFSDGGRGLRLVIDKPD